MNRELSTFQAKCQHCGHIFGHPSFGDFAYGEAILSSADGSHFAAVSAFSGFPQRLSEMVDIPNPKDFWPLVASFADPIDGQPLISSLVCPGCTSTSLEFSEGEKVGSTCVTEATFQAASLLDNSSILKKANLAIHRGLDA